MAAAADADADAPSSFPPRYPAPPPLFSFARPRLPDLTPPPPSPPMAAAADANAPSSSPPPDAGGGGPLLLLPVPIPSPAPSFSPSPLPRGIDHVRVHPKFLYSNATSHKWALGAFTELLDNALDEVSNGAAYFKIDTLKNKKDGNRMLLMEDNGGGMDPDKMWQCMCLGYSANSKLANTIGQYGNGFNMSTVRLGADVIVFSRCHGKDGKSFTQSIGMLSYMFLRSTGKEDIGVPAAASRVKIGPMTLLLGRTLHV
ncbi:hypothetical protein NL676_034115 [Syzygium grande]|nr:hypothetical protein NL676_034115 [Syzygium grande]